MIRFHTRLGEGRKAKGSTIYYYNCDKDLTNSVVSPDTLGCSSHLTPSQVIVVISRHDAVFYVIHTPPY